MEKEFLPINNVIPQVRTKYIMNITNVNMNVQFQERNIGLPQKLILQDIM
jgi:hypothetical protein